MKDKIVPFFYSLYNRIRHHAEQDVSNVSAIVFRLFFGFFMCGSLIRFFFKGWLDVFYIEPQFHFTYPGFSWVQPGPGWFLYALFFLVMLASLGIALGVFYRWSCIVFFLGFTYIELLDKTYYLNHYYAISLFSFLLIFLPLNTRFSIDSWRNPALRCTTIRAWCVWVLRAQVGIIYVFAGIAKLNSDWLFRAQPLKIWLSANSDVPIIGPVLGYSWSAYIMSWVGAIYDLTVPFFLLSRRCRPYAYITVIVFHLLTHVLFYIGVFPWMMMGITLIFFDLKCPKWLAGLEADTMPSIPVTSSLDLSKRRGLKWVLAVYFLIQILVPFRFLCYSGPLFWTEQGFRFSWRVMLMEKNGMIDFRLYSKSLMKEWYVRPNTYLTPLQAKMMSTQPDMIIQFAHYLKSVEGNSVPDLEVYAESSFVSLNGRKSQPYIRSDVNLLNHTSYRFDSTRLFHLFLE